MFSMSTKLVDFDFFLISSLRDLKLSPLGRPWLGTSKQTTTLQWWLKNKLTYVIILMIAITFAD